MTAALLTLAPRPDAFTAAVEVFGQRASTAVVPSPLVRALQSPQSDTVSMTVRGVPAVVRVGSGPLSASEVVAVWQQLLSLRDGLGDQADMFMTRGGRVVVALPGGAL